MIFMLRCFQTKSLLANTMSYCKKVHVNFYLIYGKSKFIITLYFLKLKQYIMVPAINDHGIDSRK